MAGSNTKNITKNLGGRPSKYAPDIVEKLESVFKIGGTIDEATSYAGIDKKTYYSWLEKHEGFSTKMEAAQHFADIAAKNIVIDAVVKDKDLATAKWWLEKRQFKETPQVVQQFNTQGNMSLEFTQDDDEEETT